MLTSVAGFVAYVAYVFIIPVVIWAIDTLGQTVPSLHGNLLLTVNGILWAMTAVLAGLFLFRVGDAFRNRRKGFEE